jgi:hypothetical protein
MLGKDLNNEEKLEAIYAMTLENHDILKTIRRQQYVSGTFRVLYWLLVLGALGGTYFYIRPFVTLLSDKSSTIEEKFTQFNQLKNNLPEAKIIDQVIQVLQKPSVATTTTQE